jgi:hypothetical protein
MTRLFIAVKTSNLVREYGSDVLPLCKVAPPLSPSDNTRVIFKVRGLILLLRVGTLWRCGDGLFFVVPPLASDTLLTTLHPLLENMLQTVDHFEISCLGAPFPSLEKSINRMGRDLDYMADILMGFTDPLFPSRTQNWIQILPPWDFWAFPTMKRELRGKKFRSDQRSAARFREVGGALYEVYRLQREVLRKRDRHHTSTKLRLGIMWVHELCKRHSYYHSILDIILLHILKISDSKLTRVTGYRDSGYSRRLWTQYLEQSSPFAKYPMTSNEARRTKSSVP